MKKVVKENFENRFFVTPTYGLNIDGTEFQFLTKKDNRQLERKFEEAKILEAVNQYRA